MFIDILIGADYYFSFTTGKCIKGVLPSTPVTLESSVGWVLTGPVDGESGYQYSSLTNTYVVLTSALDETLKRFWEIETISDIKGESVINRYVETIEFNGVRYVMKLPFKPTHEYLPDNYRLCENRPRSLRRRLEKDPKLFTYYHTIIKDYEGNQIIEKVSPLEVSGGSSTKS